MNGMPRRPVGLRLVDGFLDDTLETWLHTVGVEEPLENVEIARAMKGVGNQVDVLVLTLAVEHGSHVPDAQLLRIFSLGHARRHREVYLLLRPVSTFSFRNFSATLRLGVAPAPRSRIRHPGKLGLLLLELLL